MTLSDPLLTHQSDCIRNTITSFTQSLIKPLWFAEEHLYTAVMPLHPGEYGQKENVIYEIFLRCVNMLWALPLAIVTLPLAIIGHTCLAILNCCYQTPQYLHYPNKESEEKHLSIFHLNACMYEGSLPMHFGGVMPARQRIDLLIQSINAHPSDIVLLSEISGDITGTIVKRLNKEYIHFFLRMDCFAFGLNAGLFVAMKKTPSAMPAYKKFTTQGDGFTAFANKGFVKIEMDKHVIYFTHLMSGPSKTSKEIRKQQMKEIISDMNQQEKIPILIGDLNIDGINCKDEYEQTIQGNKLVLLDSKDDLETKTCTNALDLALDGEKMTPLEERLDYALSLSKELGTTKVIETFPNKITKGFSKALSDHCALHICLR